MKEFSKISSLLPGQLTCDDPPAHASAQRLLREIWRGSAGKAGLHSHPLLFSSGRLTVFVESPMWATEIRHRAPTLIGALNGGGLAVHRLDIRVQPTTAATVARSRAAPPLSDRSLKTLASTAEQISHPGLRASLQRLARVARNGKEE